MSDILEAMLAITRPSSRVVASRELGTRLGGDSLIVFVHDAEVDALLPAPGYPQRLHDARSWRRFLAECVARGQCGPATLSILPGEATAVYGFSCGSEVVAVVLGCAQRPDEVEDVRRLLPFFVTAVRSEREAVQARSRAEMAVAEARHAESLAVALDAVRGQVERTLTEAETARGLLEEVNAQLQVQAGEMEAQAVEMEMQAEELQHANASLDQARREAVAANKAKSEFLAIMSHELRTPLNAIGGYAQLVSLGLYGPVSDEQHLALQRIDRSQRHLLGLINDILNLARIEAGRVEYRIEAVPVAETLSDLDPMIAPQIEAKGMTYAVDVADPALAAEADREKVQQVLLNLISNAVKFTDRGGTIRVEASSRAGAPDQIEIRVSDTGIGIPCEKLPLIFDPFVQVDGSHSREGQGTGLGLAISRDLARGMHGDVEVTSVAGKGSTFKLMLPRYRSAGES